MKKKYFFAVMALVALAGCSSDEFVGENINSPNSEKASNAIMFNSGTKAITRADHVGADAALMLSRHFTVGGFKGNGTTRSTVFDNYIVNWGANTAGKTTSNSSDWEYVGIEVAPPSTIYVTPPDPQDPDFVPVTQTIKYWDQSASQYDFVAYSTGAANATTDAASSGNVKVTAIDPTTLTTAAYKLTGANRTDLAGCYIADMVTAYQDGSDPLHPYNKEVTLTFRSLASKVRVALYETVPGYSVTKVKFYSAHPTTLGSGSSEDNAVLIGTMNDAGEYTVKFPTIGSTNVGDPDYNKAHVSFTSTSQSDLQTFGSLDAQYTTKENREKKYTKFLGRTSKEATFAGSGTFYQVVLPNETGTVFELAIDYTLESIDGSQEDINVYGATAYIPLQFAQWLPNYAYTYIFKISDNTDGWTNTTTTDPKGLFPITFDAVVIDSEENTQSTITTVAMPSITTYQKGHNYETDGPEYEPSTSNAIYVQVMVDGALKGDLGSKGQLYTLSADKTEAEVLDALNIQASTTTNPVTITGRNNLTLTEATSDATIDEIPGEDGNPIKITAGQAASFAATTGTYAYVYDTGTWNGFKVYLTTTPGDFTTAYYTDAACTTLATGTVPTTGGYYYQKVSNIYSAENTSSKPDDFDNEGVWYTDPDGKTPAASTTWEAGYYYKKYTANAKVYGVKVIKVQ